MSQQKDILIQAFTSYEEFVENKNFLDMISRLLDELKMYNGDLFGSIFKKIQEKKELPLDDQHYILKLINDPDFSVIFVNIMKQSSFSGKLDKVEEMKKILVYHNGNISLQGLIDYLRKRVKGEAFKKTADSEDVQSKEYIKIQEGKTKMENVEEIKEVSKMVKNITLPTKKPLHINPPMKNPVQPSVQLPTRSPVKQPSVQQAHIPAPKPIFKELVKGKKISIVEKDGVRVFFDRQIGQPITTIKLVGDPFSVEDIFLCKAQNLEGLVSYFNLDEDCVVGGWFQDIGAFEKDFFKVRTAANTVGYVSLSQGKVLGEFKNIFGGIMRGNFIKVQRFDGLFAYISLVTLQPVVGWMKQISEIEESIDGDGVFFALGTDDRAGYCSFKTGQVVSQWYKTVMNGLEEGFNRDLVFKAENDNGQRAYISLQTQQPVGGWFANIFYGIEEGINGDKLFKVEDTKQKFAYISMKMGIAVTGWHTKLSLMRENDLLYAVTENIFGMEKKNLLG